MLWHQILEKNKMFSYRLFLVLAGQWNKFKVNVLQKIIDWTMITAVNKNFKVSPPVYTDACSDSDAVQHSRPQPPLAHASRFAAAKKQSKN